MNDSRQMTLLSLAALAYLTVMSVIYNDCQKALLRSFCVVDKLTAKVRLIPEIRRLRPFAVPNYCVKERDALLTQ